MKIARWGLRDLLFMRIRMGLLLMLRFYYHACIDQYKESYPRIYSLFLLVGHLVVYWHVATNTMSCNVDSSSNAY